MWRLLLIIIALTSQPIIAETIKQGKFLGAKTFAEFPSWFKNSFLDLSEDLQEATDENRHIMIYFHQNGCPYCEKLVKENFHNNALVSKLKKHFDVIQVNMWGDRELTDWNSRDWSEKEFSAFMKIQFTPTLVFLNSKGDSVLRLNGYQSVDKMHKVLDYVSNKKYLKQSFGSYTNNTNQTQKSKNIALNQSPIFDNPPHLLARSKTMPAQQYLAVFFEVSDCKDCSQLHKNLTKSPEIKKQFEQMQVIQLNAQSAQKLITPSGKKTTASQWYEALKLTYKPAIVFFDKYGVEIIRKDAMFRRFHFKSIIDYVMTGSYQNQPNFQRYIEGKSDKLRKQGIDVDIWQQEQF